MPINIKTLQNEVYEFKYIDKVKIDKNIKILQIYSEVANPDENECSHLFKINNLFIHYIYENLMDHYNLVMFLTFPEWEYSNRIIKNTKLWKRYSLKHKFLEKIEKFNELKLEKLNKIIYYGFAPIYKKDFFKVLNFIYNDAPAMLFLIPKNFDLNNTVFLRFVEDKILPEFDGNFLTTIKWPEIINFLIRDNIIVINYYGNFDFGGYYLDFFPPDNLLLFKKIFDYEHGQGSPHVHDWKTPKGRAPKAEDRQPGRSPKDGEILQ